MKAYRFSGPTVNIAKPSFGAEVILPKNGGSQNQTGFTEVLFNGSIVHTLTSGVVCHAINSKSEISNNIVESKQVHDCIIISLGQLYYISSLR